MIKYARMAAEELSIGVDMGGTTIKFAVVQGTDIVYKGQPMQTGDYPSPDCIVEEIGNRLRPDDTSHTKENVQYKQH